MLTSYYDAMGSFMRHETQRVPITPEACETSRTNLSSKACRSRRRVPQRLQAHLLPNGRAVPQLQLTTQRTSVDINLWETIFMDVAEQHSVRSLRSGELSRSKQVLVVTRRDQP